MTAPVLIDSVSHYFGTGDMRKRVLDSVSCEIRGGEIVILTGPAGSGKTTLLTLIGALRSAQEGSVRVLGNELLGATSNTLTEVRRDIGYIFQLHNLLDCLTTTQNVEMSLQLDKSLSRKQTRETALEMLGAVGLADKVDTDPSRMSGGQKQRVAIARALARRPKLILADEPTASLDKKSGRDVVSLMHDLAKKQNVSVVLVTHDNRILDVADRIIHLEDGQLQSFSDAVISNTQHMMNLLADQNRKGELHRTVIGMDENEFVSLLGQVTQDSQQFLQITDLAQGDAFESMLDQVLEIFTNKIAELLNADRATLFLLDPQSNELWAKSASGLGDRAETLRIPRDRGIVGAAVNSGEAVNVRDAYEDPRFNRAVDQATGYRTRNIFCIPLRDKNGEVFGAAQLLNKKSGDDFDSDDEERFEELMKSMGVVLESWWSMSQRR
jgi:putative ABC transport system ATP-binding protein